MPTSDPALPSPPPLDGRCPRCGGGMHCGANDALPCPCGAVALDAATLADLRARYAGCLCLACLSALARADQPGHQRAGHAGPSSL